VRKELNMARELFGVFAMCLVANTGWGQLEQTADSRTVLGSGNEYLIAGAEAIRAGQYEDGIRLTTLDLKRMATVHEKSAGLSNLCGAHAAKGEPDLAITYCTESIAINDGNWRAYSNRSYALYLKGLYNQANADLETAASINPSARQIAQLRGMINERSLRPSVTMEEHQ
jgi:tetratricopeptide (TPR) repeat protein